LTNYKGVIIVKTNSEFKKDCVLIVDDVKENIDVLNGILIENYTIKAAMNGKIALKIAEKFKPDMILLDVIMPEMDGFEVCRKLKDNPITQNIPVIFVTAKSDEVDEARGLEAGAVDYISKPVNALVVQSRVKTHLALSNQQKELAKQIRKKTSELQSIQNEIIKSLGRASVYRDNETGAHIERVSEYSYMVAKILKVDEEIAQMLKEASRMHDVGKIGIPDGILNKQGKLNADEYEIMKTHTEIGAEILGEHDYYIMKMSSAIASQHHERYDGKGYPKGLKGSEIALCARIVSVCDVFDALTSKRPYKEHWPFEKAIELLEKEKDKQFDGKVVEAFVSNIDQVRHIHDTHQDTF